MSPQKPTEPKSSADVVTFQVLAPEPFQVRAGKYFRRFGPGEECQEAAAVFDSILRDLQRPFASPSGGVIRKPAFKETGRRQEVYSGDFQTFKAAVAARTPEKPPAGAAKKGRD